MRVGFTIIYNGAHHLEHNGWMHTVPMLLDYWVIIEGAALPGGSTSWCNKLENMSSTDETIELLKQLENEYGNVVTVKGRKCGWKSKDEMVNAAITLISDAVEATGQAVNFLWQLDVDEQWSPYQMEEAEYALLGEGDCGCFHSNHFVGPNLVARGTWGEGNDPKEPLKNAYRRLWRWDGKCFSTHEPPVLIGGNGKEVLLPQRFNHYSYMFEKDVIFKSKYYNGYENLHEKWLSLQKETEFPQPISRLIDGYWGTTETCIEINK